MIEDLIKNLGESLGEWAYLLVSVMAIAETAAFVGFIAPGEFTIIFGGVLAGEGTLSIALLIGIVWASIVAGDSIGFLLGRKLGREFAVRHGARIRLTEERLRRVEEYFARHGGKTIFFGRWVGFVRPLMPFTAGASGMPYGRFLPYDVLSAGLFGTTFCLLGYIFWESFDRLTGIAGRGAVAFGILVALVIGGVLAFKRLRHAEERQRLAAALERLGRRPALRPFAVLLVWLWRALLRPVWRWLVAPVARVLGPPLRFLGRRLTPGGLGIELTTLLAIAAVTGYVFGLYTNLVVGDSPIITPGDEMALDVVRDIDSGFLTSLAKVVSVPGIWWFVAFVVASASTVLVALRRTADAAVLAAGFLLTQAGVSITKALVERPRPTDALVDVDSSSFPSGHAATAVTYVALAAIVARASGRAQSQIGLLIAAALVAALIGLSRVYLRVHYLSDVTSGWALGLATFSLCAVVALVVSYLRKNERPSLEDATKAQPASSPGD